MNAGGESIDVLYVDDEREFAETAREFLTRESDRLSITIVDQAPVGLRQFLEGQFDCIISDYEMPGLDGLELLETVREEDPTMPFILYTGQGSERVASEAISAGVTDYLQKQSGSEQYELLANKILNAVDHNRLQRSRDRHLSAIESAREGISILNGSGEFVYVNEAYADLYGYSPLEMVGEHWSLIYPDEEVALAREEILPTVEEVGYWHGETTGLRADGSTFPEDHVISQTEAGDMVCTVRNASDTRETENELWVKTRAMDEAPIGLTISDSDKEDNPLTYVNDRFIELTGYERDSVIGRNCRFLQGEETADEPVEEMAAAIDDGEPVTVELRNYRADGTEFWNRVRLAPIRGSEGRIENWVGFQEDITDRKERERQLEQSNQRLEDFASVVSHDLRNPLNVVQGRLRLALSEEDLDHVAEATDAIDRSMALIDDLLTLAREGQALGELDEVSIRAIAEDCWGTVDTQAATLEIESTETLRADKSRLRQLLENLYRNAIDHAGPDVTVTVGTTNDGFYVADTGPGIPPEERESIFEAGYTTSDGSTGFGLTIVEEVARAHDWRVSVTESESGGARFEFQGVQLSQDG